MAQLLCPQGYSQVNSKAEDRKPMPLLGIVGWMGKDVEGSRYNIWGTFLAFNWRDQGKQRHSLNWNLNCRCLRYRVGLVATEPVVKFGSIFMYSFSACLRILEMLIVTQLVKFPVYLIHCIVCLVAGPLLVWKQVLQIVWSSASSFNFQYFSLL